MSFLSLFHRCIVRDLVKRPARTLLTVAGVALGIGVVVAVHLSNERAIGSFTDSLLILSGGADYQIAANGIPLDERLVGELSWFWDYGEMSALVEGTVGLPGAGSVKVYGVDFLADAPFRQYLSGDGRDLALEVTAEEFLQLLVNPSAVVVPASLARQLSAAAGDQIRLQVGEKEKVFTIGAVLRDVGAAKAFGGRVLFMDIAGAQLALDKIGVVDRLDLALRDGVDEQALVRRLRSRLAAGALLQKPQDLAARSDKMLRSFRYNLAALSYLSLIVGVILVYNTLNISVVRRRREIATLRTLGTRRRTVLAMFLGEATLLGLAGAGLGIWLGRVMAGAADALINRTVETLYTGVSLNPFRSGDSLSFYLSMLALGAVLGGISGIPPAWRATQRPPVSTLREGFLITGKTRSFFRHALTGLLLLAAGAGLSLGPAIGGFPVLGYASALCLIAGFALLSPLLARQLLAVLARSSRRRGRVEAMLALQSVQGGLSRLVVAVVSLMIAAAMLVSVATMVGSFRETVIAWVNQTLVADLYIKAAGAGDKDWDSPVSETTIRVLEDLPGVAAIGKFRGRDIQFREGLATLAGGDFKILAERGNLLFTDGRSVPETVSAMIGRDRVIVSEPLSLKYGIRRGDRIELPTASGRTPFVVEAVYYDYSSDRGIIVMDRQSYIRHFNDPAATSLSLFLEPGEKPETVRRRIAEALPGARLAVYANADLKREALRVFDQTFQVTYALEAIAILVAVLGITNTLAALLLEREGEIALLRFLGADSSQVRRMAIVEAGLVGALGLIIGAALGLALSLVLVFVINRQSFGWTIQFDLPALFLTGSLTLVFLSTLAAGFYPALLASRADPIRSLRAE